MELAMKPMGAIGSMGPPSTELEGQVPGNRGIWVGILCELTEFALLFAVFFVARAHNPEAFSAGPSRLSLLAGTGFRGRLIKLLNERTPVYRRLATHVVDTSGCEPDAIVDAIVAALEVAA